MAKLPDSPELQALKQSRQLSIKLGQAAASLKSSQAWSQINQYFEEQINSSKEEFTVQWESQPQYKGWSREQLWDEYNRKRQPLLGYWAFKNMLDSLISARDQAREEEQNEETATGE